MNSFNPTHAARRSRRGVSLIEALIALAISAMLLAATMVATKASFKAYGDACEEASTNAATRIVVNRLLMLIRNSSAHGPLAADTTVTPNATLSGNTVTSPYMEVLDPATSDILRFEYHSDTQQLWMKRTPASGGTAQSQALLGGVTACNFYCLRRLNTQGLWVLQRGTMDLTIQPGGDTTLPLEKAPATPLRVIASTMPRKIAD